MYAIKYNLHRRLFIGRDRLLEGTVVRVFAYTDLVAEVIAGMASSMSSINILNNSSDALEDMLELIHLHCPKPNKCITEMKEFQLFFQALKHPIVKHYHCPNIVCKVYIGSSEPGSGTKCPVCATTLCCSTYFIEIPVMEQLKTILSRTFSAFCSVLTIA